MMRRFLFAVLLLFSVSLYGQHTITGVVLDSLTQEPMPSATVYVNGTTLGTATDADGRFELKGVSLPATVVFSFVGYQTQAIELNRYPESLTISLKTNDDKSVNFSSQPNVKIGECTLEDEVGTISMKKLSEDEYEYYFSKNKVLF